MAMHECALEYKVPSIVSGLFNVDELKPLDNAPEICFPVL